MVERCEPVQASPISVSEGLATLVGDAAPVPMVEFVFHTRAAGLAQPVKEMSLILAAEDLTQLLQFAYEAAVGMGLVPPPDAPVSN